MWSAEGVQGSREIVVGIVETKLVVWEGLAFAGAVVGIKAISEDRWP